MKKIIVALMLIGSSYFGHTQTVQDLLYSNDTEITWLGIDYSHVKLIGSFTQFENAGNKAAYQIRNAYFPGWNNIILHEREKYDLRAALRKDYLDYDIVAITEINSKASLEEMEATRPVRYSTEDIQNFVNEYNLEGQKGLGVLMVAERMDKYNEEAFFHFVVINIKTKEILVQERLRGRPGGFGLKNYWARPVLHIINDVKGKYFKTWKYENKKQK